MALRTRRLAIARRRATAFLVAVTVLFIAVSVTGAHGTVLGYVQAGAEASMIGGVADWFAVTAVFRHPLGIPIPHTAVIVARKDQFAGTLGQFVQENFLNGQVLAERVRAADPVGRLSTWLIEEANAERLAGHVADLVVQGTEFLRDEDVQHILSSELDRAVAAIDVAPLAGQALRVMTAGDRHTELFDAIVRGIDKYLADHYEDLRDRFVAETPNWVPDAVDRLVFDRLHTRIRRWLAAMIADPDNQARREFEEGIAGLVQRLETSSEMHERGERIKHDVLSRAELREWSSSLWQEAKGAFRSQAEQPDSELRRRLTGALIAMGQRLRSDEQLKSSLEQVAESGARALAEQFHDELAGLVTGTIERWDAAETSSQLELLLGRDLQFIRINGTVVGAAIGLALHAIAQSLA